MRIVLQRVSRARVEVEGAAVGAVERGLVALVGVAPRDDLEVVRRAAAKLAGLRIFDDERGRMDRTLAEAGGRLLLVSQFTLLASTDRGRRPSFERAAKPEVAEPLVEALRLELKRLGVEVESGRFGAAMRVELVNEGPVTLVLDFEPRGD